LILLGKQIDLQMYSQNLLFTRMVLLNIQLKHIATSSHFTLNFPIG